VGDEAGDVASGPRQARHDPYSDRVSVAGKHEHDRHGRRLLLGGERQGNVDRDDHIGLEPQQLGNDGVEALELAFGRAAFEDQVLSIGIADAAHRVQKLPHRGVCRLGALHFRDG
jgi:hypothetical protein